MKQVKMPSDGDGWAEPSGNSGVAAFGPVRAGRRCAPVVIAGLILAAMLGACQSRQGKSPVSTEPREQLRRKEVPVEPCDQLRHEKIPDYNLAAAGGGDPAKAPKELVAVLGDARFKHWSTVCSVAFGPDGKRIVSGSFDRIVRKSGMPPPARNFSPAPVTRASC